MPVASGSGQFQPQSLSVLSTDEVSAIGTSNLRNGDAAVVNHLGAAFPDYFGLFKDSVEAIDGSTVLATLDSDDGGSPGRWIILTIGALP